MLFEIIIVFEILAFVLIALGLLPYQKSVDLEGNEKSAPYLNRIILVVMGTILFFSLAITTNIYDYNYCFIQNTTSNYAMNMTVSQATCASYKIMSPDLAYLNLGMGMAGIILIIVLIIFAALARKELRGRD